MATKRPPGLIYDERDIDAVVRTMLGEAAGEGDDGLAAIAHVAANRFDRGTYGKTLYDVVHAPKQFSAWNNASIGGNSLVNVSADDPRYQQARAIAEEVLNGQRADNTNGAVNYFAPKGMTGKLGTVKGEPKWAGQMSYTTTIGGHKFYSDDSAAGAAEKMAKGSSVRTYQQQLAQRGFDPGPVDGVRGPRTTAAVKAFQKANGLTSDGIVGPKTMAALQGQQRPQTQPQPPGWARQPANILAPPPLIQPSDVRDAFFNPLPAPKPLTPPADPGRMVGLGNGVGYGPGWQTLNTLKDISAGVYDRPAAPMPMPGRPPSLSTPPPIPGQQPPMPMPGRPAGLNGTPPPVPPSMPAKTQTAPPATPKLLRLPSGQMIAPGSYDNAKSGIPYTVTEGPNGTAIVKSQRAGLVDIGKEINAPTILGGIIRSKIPEGVQAAVQNFGPTIDSVKNTAANAINTAVPAVQGFGNQIGGFFGNIGGLFGGSPPAVPGPQFQQGMLGRGLPVPRAPMPLTPSPMLRTSARPQAPQPPQFTATQRRQMQQDDWARRGLNEFGMLS
jgi:peptidoglycan hydrolase-like protein with peptidoglycan-binding domain